MPPKITSTLSCSTSLVALACRDAVGRCAVLEEELDLPPQQAAVGVDVVDHHLRHVGVGAAHERKRSGLLRDDADFDGCTCHTHPRLQPGTTQRWSTAGGCSFFRSWQRLSSTADLSRVALCAKCSAHPKDRSPHFRYRRVSPIPVRPGGGRLTEPITAIQPGHRERGDSGPFQAQERGYCYSCNE